MKSSLKTIQTLSKIGKILSKIVFIFSIVGAVGCLVGIICLALGIDGALKFGGINIKNLIELESNITVSQMYIGMISAFIMVTAEAVLAKFAEVYFKHELEAGTPFTYDGAKEMLRLGVLGICIPIGAKILSSIICAVISVAVLNVKNVDIKESVSISLGITFIVISFILKYGAEISCGNIEKTNF